MRVVGIVGAPAAGKSSLVRALLPLLGPGQGGRFGVLHWMHYPEANVIVLGSYEPRLGYPGTDAYDRGTCAVAADYARLLFRDGGRWLPAGVTLLWEGILFAEPPIVEAMSEQEHLLIELVVPSATLSARYTARGQDRPAWGELFSARLASLADLAIVECWPSETPDHQRRNLEQLATLLRLPVGVPA